MFSYPALWEVLHACLEHPSVERAVAVFEEVLQNPIILSNEIFFHTALKKNQQVIKELSENRYPPMIQASWLARNYQERLVAARNSVVPRSRM